MYQSEQIHHISNPSDENPVILKHKVIIKGSIAYKEHAKVDHKGKILHKKKHRLTKRERRKILDRVFIPKLWHCCKKTRKQWKL
jgi:hypothetical protein